MTRFPLSPCLAVISVCFVTSALTAQTPYRVTRTPAQLLAAFEHERESATKPSAAGGDITAVLVHHDEYPESMVNSILDGLQKLAITPASPRIGAEAAYMMAIPSTGQLAHSLPGMFARLKLVYDQTNESSVRLAVVGVMARLNERQAAIPFLVEVASTQDSVDSGGLAGKALTALMLMGDEGRAALKRVHDSHVVRDPDLVQSLEVMAKNDYRIPERRHQ